VQVRATGNAFYPDVLEVCGQAEIIHEIRGGDSLLNPAVIVEVLSPSTESYDRGQKFDENYRFIPSLREYVLVAQDEPVIEVRSREDSGGWISREFRSGERATLAAIACSLDVDTLYAEARKNLCTKR
jgi:Uma2 family endonuclease